MANETPTDSSDSGADEGNDWLMREGLEDVSTPSLTSQRLLDEVSRVEQRRIDELERYLVRCCCRTSCRS